MMRQWSCHVRRIGLRWSPRSRSHGHVLRVIPMVRADIHHFMSTNISNVPLLPLMLVVCELDNEGSGRSLHDEVIVQAFDGLYCRFLMDESQKGRTFAGSIHAPDHVYFSNLSKGSKELLHIFLASLSR